jgi:hypothetical protein
MPKKSKTKSKTDDVVQQIGKLAEVLKNLAQQARSLNSIEVDAIISDKIRDLMRIERCLDRILDFCFDDEMLLLYKKLCRYYFYIDPEATVFYINAYREMWDEKDSTTDEIDNPEPGHSSAKKTRKHSIYLNNLIVKIRIDIPNFHDTF